MARAANLDVLLHSLLPVWNQRLAARDLNWNGAIDLHLEGRCWQLQFDGSFIGLVTDASAASEAIRLTQQHLIQLCFAYPTALFAARESIANLSISAAQAFSVLFAGQPTS